MKNWKRMIGLLLVFALIAGMMTACGKKDDEKKEEEQKPDAADIADADYVSLEDGFTDVKIVDEKTALEAVTAQKEALGMTDPAVELKVTDVSKYDGETYYRMQQYYNDVPVYGREAVLIADDKGQARGLSSNIAKVNGNVSAAGDASGIDYPKLLETVETLLKNDKLSFLDFKCETQPETVYYSDGGASIRPCFKDIVSFSDTNKKQYAFEVLFDCNSYEIVSVDIANNFAGVSASGNDKDGLNRKFTAYRESYKQYLMYDENKDIAVFNAQNNTVVLAEAIYDDQGDSYTYQNGKLYDKNGKQVYLNNTGTEILDENKTVIGKNLEFGLKYSASPNPDDLVVSESTSTVWNDPNAVTAVSRVQNAYDFYNDVLGRKSYNGKGGSIRIFYNDALNGDPTNAYSYDQPDMTALSFGEKNNIAFDVVGHEFTHSVVGSFVDLPYRNQTGAINEGYADIFGEIIEDYSDGKLDNSCNWISDTYRNHIDPLSEGNPVVYKGDNWAKNISVPEILSNTPLQIINMYTDNGGVHTNSTILSHAAYLMNNGIDGTQEKKISTEMLAKIWYKSMYSLHSNETFKQCAKHVYDAAKRTSGLTAAQLLCVKEAFAQAGLEVK